MEEKVKEKEIKENEKDADDIDSFLVWLLRKKKTPIYIASIVFVAMFIIIYLVFSGTTIIPAGKNLRRSDWLVFTGSVIAFLGSMAVSIVSISQATYFKEVEDKRRIRERKSEIAPEIVIEVMGRNLRIPDLDRFPSRKLYNAMYGVEMPSYYSEPLPKSVNNMSRISCELSKKKYIDEHPTNNVWLSIINAGKYSVKDLFLYDEYYFPFIRTGEVIQVLLTEDEYSRPNQSKRYNNGIEIINNGESSVKIIDVRKENKGTEDFVKSPHHYDNVWMRFEDIDGNKYYQKFNRIDSENGTWYSGDRMIKE